MSLSYGLSEVQLRLETAFKQADYDANQAYEQYRRLIELRSQIKAALDLLNQENPRGAERIPESSL